jgi:hypothetical protein
MPRPQGGAWWAGAVGTERGGPAVEKGRGQRRASRRAVGRRASGGDGEHDGPQAEEGTGGQQGGGGDHRGPRAEEGSAGTGGRRGDGGECGRLAGEVGTLGSVTALREEKGRATGRRDKELSQLMRREIGF